MDEAEARSIVDVFLKENELTDINQEVDRFNSPAITPLGIAVHTMKPSVVSALLKLGASLDAPAADTEGLTPLARACEWTAPDRYSLVVTGKYPERTNADAIQIVQMLVDAKADIESKGKGGHDGFTPLINAGGNLQITRVLLEAKADVNVRAGFGEHTALMKTACTPLNLDDHLDVIKLLVEHKADVQTLDNRDFNCIKAMKFAHADTADNDKMNLLLSLGVPDPFPKE